MTRSARVRTIGTGALLVAACAIALAAAVAAASEPLPPTVRASVSTDDTQANEASLMTPASGLSADGSRLVFVSAADNLVPGDTNGESDAFLRDFASGETSRVSVASDGSQGTIGCLSTAISGDGDVVAFHSYADNLVPDDTNLAGDIFVRDLRTGLTVCASVDPSGAPGARSAHWPLVTSELPSLSSDGRYVSFCSSCENLVADDTNDSVDVFVRDMQTQQTTRVTVGPGGAQGTDWMTVRSSLSGNGRLIAFESVSTNLVAHDSNDAQDIFVRDLDARTTRRVSVSTAGEQARGWSMYPSISADGRFVVFDSDAANLVPGDTNSSGDVFIRDLAEGTTARVSVDSFGVQANDLSYNAAVSGDGRYVAFQSAATNLVPGDTNGVQDIFIRDRQTGTTVRVSVDSSGTQSNGESAASVISSSGAVAAFWSDATNLVSGDTNGVTDVFMHGTFAVPEQAWVRTPIAPRRMSHAQYYTIYGYLKPRHRAGTWPVRIYLERKTARGWRSYDYKLAKAYNYYGFTKYARRIRLPYTGTWRLRAYAKPDALHAAAWSTGYDTVTVY